MSPPAPRAFPQSRFPDIDNPFLFLNMVILLLFLFPIGGFVNAQIFQRNMDILTYNVFNWLCILDRCTLIPISLFFQNHNYRIYDYYTIFCFICHTSSFKLFPVSISNCTVSAILPNTHPSFFDFCGCFHYFATFCICMSHYL